MRFQFKKKRGKENRGGGKHISTKSQRRLMGKSYLKKDGGIKHGSIGKGGEKKRRKMREAEETWLGGGW